MLAFIPGVSDGSEFIQVITNDCSIHIPYIGNNFFSPDGIKVDIDYKNYNIYGEISYSELVPLKYDIMGFFKYFPMECRHGVISMYHKLSGTINFCGKPLDLNGGIGYIEMDSGTSFPTSYLWLHCNAFHLPCSIMLSVADIPFMGINFTGVICAIWYGGKEYRLATYKGVKILRYDEEGVTLKQGKYLLEVEIAKKDGQKLFAPKQGVMTREIKESNVTKARFRFFEEGKLLFDLNSDFAGFEYVKKE